MICSPQWNTVALYHPQGRRKHTYRFRGLANKAETGIDQSEDFMSNILNVLGGTPPVVRIGAGSAARRSRNQTRQIAVCPLECLCARGLYFRGRSAPTLKSLAKKTRSYELAMQSWA